MRKFPLLVLAAGFAACSGSSSDGGAGPGGASSSSGGSGSASGGASSGTSGEASSGASGGTSSGASGSSGNPDGGPCTDTCPAPNGITWGCEKRFLYGSNWAWLHYAGDFGGIAAFGQGGVASASASFDAALKAMKAGGVNVVRWWMFPRFLTESITFGADDAPSGIGGTLVADIQKALDLADANDMYIMLTPFSFDNFKPTANESGINSRGIQPMVVDATKRKELLDNLVIPVANAVEQSPHKHRMIAWDMVNEPEWAITGSDPYGDEAFTPDGSVQTVTFAQMESFLQDMEAAYHAHSSALVSIGNSAIKWGKAWTHVKVDFYMFHYYEWVYQYYPYKTVTPQSLGLTDKPVVLGEYPLTGFTAVGNQPARTPAEFSADLWTIGYAGSMAWAYDDPAFPWSATALTGFPAQHACETKY